MYRNCCSIPFLQSSSTGSSTSNSSHDKNSDSSDGSDVSSISTCSSDGALTSPSRVHAGTYSREHAYSHNAQSPQSKRLILSPRLQRKTLPVAVLFHHDSTQDDSRGGVSLQKQSQVQPQRSRSVNSTTGNSNGAKALAASSLRESRSRACCFDVWNSGSNNSSNSSIEDRNNSDGGGNKSLLLQSNNNINNNDFESNDGGQSQHNLRNRTYYTYGNLADSSNVTNDDEDVLSESLFTSPLTQQAPAFASPGGASAAIPLAHGYTAAHSHFISVSGRECTPHPVPDSASSEAQRKQNVGRTPRWQPQQLRACSLSSTASSPLVARTQPTMPLFTSFDLVKEQQQQSVHDVLSQKLPQHNHTSPSLSVSANSPSPTQSVMLHLANPKQQQRKQLQPLQHESLLPPRSQSLKAPLLQQSRSLQQVHATHQPAEGDEPRIQRLCPQLTVSKNGITMPSATAADSEADANTLVITPVNQCTMQSQFADAQLQHRAHVLPQSSKLARVLSEERSEGYLHANHGFSNATQAQRQQGYVEIGRAHV